MLAVSEQLPGEVGRVVFNDFLTRNGIKPYIVDCEVILCSFPCRPDMTSDPRSTANIEECGNELMWQTCSQLDHVHSESIAAAETSGVMDGPPNPAMEIIKLVPVKAWNRLQKL